MNPTSRVPSLLLVGLALAAAFVLPAAPAAAQRTAAEAEKPPDQDAYRPWKTHRPQHDLYDLFEGTWESDLTVWLYGEPPKEAVIYSRLEGEWLYEERYMKVDLYRREAGADFGSPDHLVEIRSAYHFGWDPYKKKYYYFYIGIEDLVPLTAYASWDPESRTLVFEADEEDPVTGDRFRKKEHFILDDGDRSFRYVLRYGFADGSEITAAEGTYRRPWDFRKEDPAGEAEEEAAAPR